MTLLLFTACAPYPQNSKEYRATFHNKADGFKEGYETYTVEKTVKEVAKSLRTYVKKTFSSDGEYVPTLMVKQYRIELYLQKNDESFLSWFKPAQPDSGAFVIVVDIYRNTADSVKVDFYKVSDKYSHMIVDMKKWIDVDGISK
jgi:hypothetical protein